jgi:hypothetical protein
VLDHRGTHYELSDVSVPSCVHLKNWSGHEWKAANVVGRWTGRVKSCWYKRRDPQVRFNSGPADIGMPASKDSYVTIPAHDVIVVCLPYVNGVGGQPACQEIAAQYFTAIDSLPRPAF